MIAVLVVLIPEWIADGTLNLGESSSRSNLPLAHEGDALFHLGYFKELPRAEDIVETFATAHGQENNTA